MQRAKKKRNKKYVPRWLSEGITEEQYLMKPWKRISDDQEASNEENLEEIEE